MPFTLEYIEELKKLFVHLHNHSEYSNIRLLDSTNKLKDMVLYVNSLGQTAMAITEHEALCSHLKLLNIVEKLKEEGKINKEFKAILGNEIYLVDEEEMNREREELGYTTFFHFILLAKDNIGHEQLRKLSSTAWKRLFNYKGMERVPTYYNDFDEIIGEDKGHLIASTACLGGKLAKLVSALIIEEDKEKQEELRDKIDDFINWCVNMFGKDDFYIELQPSFMNEEIEENQQRAYNKMAITIAKAYGLKWIITTDAHYRSEADREIHKAFLTSDEDGNGNREVDAFYSTTRFFKVEELFEYMNYLEKEDIAEAILNTNEIRNKIVGYDFSHKQIIPLTPLPDENTWDIDEDLYKQAKKYPNVKSMIESNEIHDRYLMNMSLNGFKDRIKDDAYEESLERMNVECEQILGISDVRKQPISGYFTTMKKNIDLIWEEAQAFVMAGRGSAGGYIINDLIGITQVNPLTQGVELPYFRFIHKSKAEMPDIDIDVPSHKKNLVFQKLKDYYNSINGDIIRVCTFGTETSKSAIQTTCRGLKINSDVGMYLSSLIPIDRGKVWSVHDCYYGNEETDRKAVTEFKNIVDEYNERNLLEVVLGIEGLINRRSSHPCGSLIVNQEFTKHNAIMRGASGELISQFDLSDSESMGGIKYDLLCTKVCSMIQLTMEMLLKNNKIEWQGTLRDTYNKYLHPDFIDKTSKPLWDKLNNGELLSAFQFEGGVGEQAIKLIQPENMIEAVNGNNLMRLMSEEGKEQPLNMFVRYKNNIKEWYDDMKTFGLNENEVVICKKLLSEDFGVCNTQEKMMLISMDDEVSAFDVPTSNILRKGVSKKKGELYEKAHNLFYQKGRENGCRDILLDYLWNVQIAMQKGYGFSVIHGVEYTYILIQQLNLIEYYPSVYWNTAVLLVESGAIELESAEEQEVKGKEKTTNYGEVAKAIGKLQSKNVKISLPYINKAEQGFVPNEKDNEIIFGLKGIMTINNETSQLIMENRPFISISDFHKRMVLVKREKTLMTGKKQMKSLVTESQTITLIKAGAFDEVENKPREVILEEYIRRLHPSKNKLNSKDIGKISEFGLLPVEYKEAMRYYNFRQYLMTFKKIKDEDSKTISWYKIQCINEIDTDYTVQFFLEYFSNDMQENRDYKYDENGVLWIALGTSRKGSFDSIYMERIQILTDWLLTKDCKDTYNKVIFENVKRENMSGNISSWEMEAMNFYYNQHELINVNKELYDVVDFNSLTEEPATIGFTHYKGLQYPKFELHRIIGTVLDRDKNKHTISLLTPTGVVSVKFYAGQFGFYDRTISKENGFDTKGKIKKVVMEDGWFKRGQLLMITGFRRGDIFKPKRYKNSVYQHSVSKITEVKDDGMLVLQSERVQIVD